MSSLLIKELLGFRDRKFDVTVRSGDNVHRNKFTDPFGSCASGIRGRFYRTDITAHKHGTNSRPTNFTLAAFTIASAASMAPTIPLVSTIPNACSAIFFTS
jgi:hypothetical protein